MWAGALLTNYLVDERSVRSTNPREIVSAS
jgi:hypothetical protein